MPELSNRPLTAIAKRAVRDAAALGNSLSMLLLGCAQNRAQSFANDHFLAGLDGHRNQFNMVGRFAFLARWHGISLTDRCYQAGIVGAKHFNTRIARTQLADAIPDGE